ncbi:MAG: rane bound O-acyl transferase family protein [Mucilaginibacter sp.]|nr:rane bound O-acyl transferase family protein [Mucilaginibacter sp.]
MVFNSLQFFLFYIIVTVGYYLLPHRFRWLLLLLVSCYFYMAFVPIYILILAGTIIIDYFAGIYLEKIADQKKRKRFLILSIVTNVGILCVFKYYNFFAANINDLADSAHITGQLFYLKILLPIGLSFHTFQAMSYTIEVYRGNQKAEKHFGIYALYVMFYPQLVAGPIERPQNVLHQFHEEHRFNFENIKSGLMQMAFGLFKKVVIADRISILVDAVYAHPRQNSASNLAIATCLYSFQIYCDFSGYSDMAIGAAKTMGIDLMTNFRSPYLSRSVNEFWTRWHISLSTWFRDYLYIPLGGNKVPVPRWFLNLFIVFLISGFWHGANWTFIAWGALHGIFLIVEIIKNMLLKKAGYSFKPNALKSIFQALITFILVSFAWIFFRSPNVHTAFYISGKILSGNFSGATNFAINQFELLFTICLIVALLIKEYYFAIVSTKNTTFFIVMFSIIMLLCYLFGIFNNKQFIYFQF